MSPTEVLLRGREITRRWGGLVAVDRVSLELERGSVHAVIGTNGAGKSTLINILSGEIPPSGGQVELLGQDVTAWTQPRRAWLNETRGGAGRSRACAFSLPTTRCWRLVTLRICCATSWAPCWLRPSSPCYR